MPWLARIPVSSSNQAGLLERGEPDPAQFSQLVELNTVGAGQSTSKLRGDEYVNGFLGHEHRVEFRSGRREFGKRCGEHVGANGMTGISAAGRRMQCPRLQYVSHQLKETHRPGEVPPTTLPLVRAIELDIRQRCCLVLSTRINVCSQRAMESRSSR